MFDCGFLLQRFPQFLVYKNPHHSVVCGIFYQHKYKSTSMLIYYTCEREEKSLSKCLL